MVDGVTGLFGTTVRLRVGVHNIAEQGFVTIQHQLTVVVTALLTVKVTLNRRLRNHSMPRYVIASQFKKNCLDRVICHAYLLM